MKHIRFMLTLLIAFLLLPIIVMAAGTLPADITTAEAVVEAVNNGWAKIGWEVLSVVLGIVTTVAISVGTALAYKYFGVKISAEQTQMLQGLAHQAINYTEQKAKAGKIEKTDRAQVALNFMTKSVKNSKLPNIAADRLTDYIEAELGLINGVNGKN